jgi:beta-glucanase (GH16 family)
MFYFLIILLSIPLLLSSCVLYEDSGDTPDSESFTLFQAMDAHDNGFWSVADGWTNGLPFLSGWCQDQVSFAEGKMVLTVSDTPCAEERYAGGEYRSNELYSYGYYEVRMRAATGNGVVSSFFTYTGISDGNPHDEIDFEFLGNDTSKVQLNYWSNGVEHPQIVDLGFDAAAGFHTYAFDWRADGIRWYVDGELVRSVSSADGNIPSTPGKVMANVWACDETVWCGQFTADQLPAQASYDWIGYRP